MVMKLIMYPLVLYHGKTSPGSFAKLGQDLTSRQQSMLISDFKATINSISTTNAIEFAAWSHT